MPNDRGDFTRQFGEALRTSRVEQGLSQEALALAAGLHRTHISLIERNRRSIRLETLERLAAALGVAPASLIPGPTEDVDDGRHDGSHPDRRKLDLLFPAVRKYQELAGKHGVRDIFQDNGGKLLQTLLILNLSCIHGREGNDARDSEGNEYELKTVNVDLTHSFSTHHHLNPTILDKYRRVKGWYFSIYKSIELIKIYRVQPSQLENDYFGKWERKWHETKGKDINNPKIPVSFVESRGELVYTDPVNDSL